MPLPRHRHRRLGSKCMLGPVCTEYAPQNPSPMSMTRGRGYGDKPMERERTPLSSVGAYAGDPEVSNEMKARLGKRCLYGGCGGGLQGRGPHYRGTRF